MHSKNNSPADRKKTSLASNLLVLSAAFALIFFFSDWVLKNFETSFRIQAYYLDFYYRFFSKAKKEDLLRAPRDQQVSKDTFNLIFLGDSTIYGAPYGPELQISNEAAYLLGGRLGGKPLRPVNLGVAAKDSNFVYALLQHVFRYPKEFLPSALVVYVGNNEFIKFHQNIYTPWPWFTEIVTRSPLLKITVNIINYFLGRSLESDDHRLFDFPLFPLKDYEVVIRNYRKRLEQIIDLARSNRVPVILMTVVTDHRDWEPNRSVCYEHSLGSAAFHRAESEFQQAREIEIREPEKSIVHYQNVLQECPNFAEAYYRLGHVYDRIGDYKKAVQFFDQAVDFDALPVRALPRQNEMIRSFSQREGVYVVDVENFFRGSMKKQVINQEVMIDGVHPNLKGYLMMSEYLASRLAWIFDQRKLGVEPKTVESEAKKIQQNPARVYNLLIDEGRWTARLATWRYDPSRRLERARKFFEESVLIFPDRFEGYLGLSKVSILEKKFKEAQSHLDRAKALDARGVDDYFKKIWVRNVFAKLKQ